MPYITKLFGQLSGIVAIVGAVHDKMTALRGAAAGAQELAAFGCIPDLAGEEP